MIFDIYFFFFHKEKYFSIGFLCFKSVSISKTKTIKHDDKPETELFKMVCFFYEKNLILGEKKIYRSVSHFDRRPIRPKFTLCLLNGSSMVFLSNLFILP
jgi:hypothetical protein